MGVDEPPHIGIALKGFKRRYQLGDCNIGTIFSKSSRLRARTINKLQNAKKYQSYDVGGS